MNTSKQVNVMIGVLFLAFLLFGAYILNESNRAADAREHITERNAERGARLFVANCRNCHGMEGEGHVAPALNSQAYLILDEEEAAEAGVEPTGQGEADAVRAFLFNTIACGRTNTFMPTWASRFGGPLSDTQINQLVTLITEGRWDLVEEVGAEVDHETGFTPEQILVQDASTLSVTERNCGQFNAENGADIRNRNPFQPAQPTPEVPAAGQAGATATQPGSPSTPAAAGPGTVQVQLRDLALSANPAQAPAGGVTFATQNTGAIVHNLRVIKTDLAPDALPVQGGTVQENRVEIVARSRDLTGRQNENVTANLQPGRYVLICNVPGHYQAGMRAGFTVQ